MYWCPVLTTKLCLSASNIPALLQGLVRDGFIRKIKELKCLCPSKFWDALAIGPHADFESKIFSCLCQENHTRFLLFIWYINLNWLGT